MALTRKFLAALGIESEKIDQIVEANAESLADIQDKLAKANAELKEAKSKADTLPTVQKELDDLKAQVEADNKAREGKDYDALKKEFDDYKADIQAKAVKSAKEKAFRDLLTDMKVSDKGVSLILKYQGVNGIELDEDGKLKDAPALRKAVKEDWSDYISTVETKGADTKTPLGSDSGAGKMTKADIMKIKDTSERQKAIAENPELFGIQ